MQFPNWWRWHHFRSDFVFAKGTLFRSIILAIASQASYPKCRTLEQFGIHFVFVIRSIRRRLLRTWTAHLRQCLMGCQLKFRWILVSGKRSTVGQASKTLNTFVWKAQSCQVIQNWQPIVGGFNLMKISSKCLQHNRENNLVNLIRLWLNVRIYKICRIFRIEKSPLVPLTEWIITFTLQY